MKQCLLNRLSFHAYRNLYSVVVNNRQVQIIQIAKDENGVAENADKQSLQQA